MRTTYAWDSRNLLTGQSRTGLTASFVYDGLGRRKSKTINGTTTEAMGSDTIYGAYEGALLTAITDPKGRTSLTNWYDANGRVQFQRLADEGTSTFAYTLTGNTVTQTQVTNPPGNITTYTFNPAQYKGSRVGYRLRPDHDLLPSMPAIVCPKSLIPCPAQSPRVMAD